MHMATMMSTMLSLIGSLGMARAADAHWTLATDDTSLTIAVASNKLYIVGLQNPAQNWNWVPTAAEVPFPGKTSIKVDGAVQTPNWTFAGATEDKTGGNTVTLRFTSTTPALELQSVWRALPGPGPVENEVSIVNQSATNVTFGNGLLAAEVPLTANAPLIVHRAVKTAVGVGKVEGDLIAAGAHGKTDSNYIPFLLVGAGLTHGAYLGFEWELGGFQWSAGPDPRRLTCTVLPVTEDVTRAPGSVFLIPSVYYGTYQGDFDDGGNRFKQWFWNHKITRSLHDHPDEPWVEMCFNPTGKTPQAAYDKLAATGAEVMKMDFWDGSGKCWYTDRDWQFHSQIWSNGFDFAAKAHKAGVKAALYMGGTYNDADLTTLAGRDAELEAVLSRYDKGWFDIWRTDRYTAPKIPMPDTYEGVANFLCIQDRLIESRPGYRYENCCNGGKYKGFAICRRMIFCTMNDDDKHEWVTRTTYFSNTYAINPAQLKSDVGTGTDDYHFRTAMMGSWLTWDNYSEACQQHIALYKEKQRPILRGANVYHILPWLTAPIGTASSTSTRASTKARSSCSSRPSWRWMAIPGSSNSRDWTGARPTP